MRRTAKYCATSFLHGRCNRSAASGAAALEFLRVAAVAGKSYDLALLDVQMPEMDGFTLARAIKIDPVIAKTPLIVLTSLGQALSTAELKESGIEAYLVKPVKQSRLFDCMIKAMGNGMAENITFKLTPPASAGICSEPSLTLEKVRILLAEDNSVNQKVALDPCSWHVPVYIIALTANAMQGEREKCLA
jgi:CheY-like chemotaxis protein